MSKKKISPKHSKPVAKKKAPAKKAVPSRVKAEKKAPAKKVAKQKPIEKKSAHSKKAAPATVKSTKKTSGKKVATPVKKSNGKNEKKTVPAKKVAHQVAKHAKPSPQKKATISHKKPEPKKVVAPAKKSNGKNEKKTIPAEKVAHQVAKSAKHSKSSPQKKTAPAKNTEKTISVPRDTRASSSKLSVYRKSVAYTPMELEQLLFQRGVTNMNIFDPNITHSAPIKKVEEKKVILTKLPKNKEKRTIGAASMADLFGFNPFEKNSVSAEEKLIPEKWLKYYHKLMLRKNELLNTISRHSENAFRKEGKEETGDVSAYSQHTADIDNEAFDRDFAISRLATEQEELAEINIAVERMKKGTYGICEITGKPIPAERLNKVPFTRYSVEGKIEAEKQRRIENRRRRANTTADLTDVIDVENDLPVSLPEEHDEP